jgi:hypothetical protein
MAYDKVIDSTKLDSAMTATADAIRGKTGGTAQIAWDETTGFASAVGEIETGGGGGGDISGWIDGTIEEVVDSTASKIEEYALAYKSIVKADLCVTRIERYAFANSYDLKVLILRYNGVVKLANTNALTSCGLYDSYGEAKYGGKIYVPQSYISQYTRATNWSGVFNGSIELLPIEGSEYE